MGERGLSEPDRHTDPPPPKLPPRAQTQSHRPEAKDAIPDGATSREASAWPCGRWPNRCPVSGDTWSPCGG